MGTATAARHYATVNPYTGETVREFESLTRDEVDAAIVEAHDASSPPGASECAADGARPFRDPRQ
jgi:acyl-CoA reductase-like NAD-dependent aldehyde dehydrogenase